MLDRAKSLENDLRITLNKLAINNKNASQQWLRSEAIMNSMDEAIILSGPQHEVLYLNRKAISIFGLHHLDYTQYKLEDLWQVLQERNNAQIEEGKRDEVNKIINTKQTLLSSNFSFSFGKNTHIYLKGFTGPIYDDYEGYLGRIWKFEDQTAQVLLDQVKSDFISIASHQLRTPITSISGYLSMIEDGDYGEIPENLKEPIEAVIRASLQMKDLINDLLSTSRLEAKKVLPEIKSVNTIEIVNEEIEKQKEIAQTKGIQINLTTNKQDIVIDTDPVLFAESIKNYLSNAIKYSPHDSIVTIELNSDDHYLTVKVIDQGIGIPLSAQEHLFQKMFRADNVLKENFEGTGLGLYYVKQAIEALGGSVAFASEENKGSAFCFKIPTSQQK